MSAYLLTRALSAPHATTVDDTVLPEASADSMLMLFQTNIFWHVSDTHTYKHERPYTHTQSVPPSTWFAGCSEIKNKKRSLASLLFFCRYWTQTKLLEATPPAPLMAPFISSSLCWRWMVERLALCCLAPQIWFVLTQTCTYIFKVKHGSFSL